MCFEKLSPFEPRNPVSPENFEGRDEIINDYIRYLDLAVYGKPQHFYLHGKRGVGKSSVASYLMEYTKIKYNFVGVHVYNDGVHDIDNLINNIVERLLDEIKNESWGKKIINLFKDNIESVGFLGNSIRFKPDNQKIIKHIKDSFPEFLVNILNNLDDKNGLFIIIDDINGLSKTPNFANWYKSFADTLATNFKIKIPIVMMLTSHPKVARSLYNHNPSFNRNFVYRSINSLKNFEVEEFFTKTFKSKNIDIDDDALKVMVEFSAGSPTMMQSIGDEIYWICNESCISKEIALFGIKQASIEIKKRFLLESLNDFDINTNDLNILRVLGKRFIDNPYKNYYFKFEDISTYLTKFDEEIYKNFINKALNVGIIEIKGDSLNKEFEFRNDLFPIYFSIDSS